MDEKELLIDRSPLSLARLAGTTSIAQTHAWEGTHKANPPYPPSDCASEQRGEIYGEKVADALDRYIRRVIGSDYSRIMCKLALAWKHRGYPITQAPASMLSAIPAATLVRVAEEMDAFFAEYDQDR